MSLYKIYRPKGLKNFFGNEQLKKDLKPFMDGKKELPHCVLLTGPSGAGKTTIARIAAKKILGCAEQDITELDIGDTRGIDAARSIRQQMWNAPIASDARAYILDEVHQATKDFQSAMLKSLEEPPEHVWFFLCTTDPQALLKTIITRCTEFTVETLDIPELVQVMQRICAGEDVQIPDEVLKKLAKQARGSARAAISLLERVLGRDPDDYDAAVDSFTDLETSAQDLCQALLAKKKWSVAAAILSKMKSEPEAARRAIIGYMQSVLLNGKDSGQAALVLDCFVDADTYRSGMPALTLAAYKALLVE